MNKEELQKTGIAYHEAGHAIVAIDLVGVVNNVRIIRGNAEWKGTISVDPTGWADTQDAAYFSAGSIAQEKGAPGSAGLYTDAQDQVELQRLANKQGDCPLLSPFAPPDVEAIREAFLAQADKTAIAILKRRWHDVGIIARALLEPERTLNHKTILQLLAPKKEG
jgi:hypothetical protein